ncbi:class I SAM-dependent methyltransferase [Actinopolymorpha rutila]|uniref:SAM-dependent methyltransferase n=1 Tax=Actinopolymorpha rutila TaxID=446787 RepID=A0A852ZH91_9ACTN|nr:class I SAM-dependent methyltransferase [Actinopolymorpha rutila]NYH91022.1 SAM-dependent methyltransferase [Actinopolymorpha rutila]
MSAEPNGSGPTAPSDYIGSADPTERERRAESFGAGAAAYAEFRPSYPETAVRWALEPVAGDDVVRVLDLAAGTGKLTEVVRGLGMDAVAVEPDAAMLAELSRRLPDVPAFTGTAEAIPAPDGAFDAVVVGQAFHWFDRDRALAEIARVLRPGGVLAALWNLHDDGVAWVAGLNEVAQALGSVRETRESPMRQALFEHVAFADQTTAEFGSHERRTSEQVVGMLATHSRILVMDEVDRAQVLGRVRGYLRARPETSAGEFDVPLVTIVLRAVRV